MTKISEDAWKLLDAGIRECTESIVLVAKYDDAIFAAYRLVEANLQERLSSSSIGQALISEAFDGPKPRLNIAKNPKDSEAIRQLFVGALGHIRNDRGHKRIPAIPCIESKICFQYLATASLLLYYLEQDRTLWPTIDAVRLYGTIASPTLEIRGMHLDRVRSVFAAKVEVLTTLRSPALLECSLPARFQGLVHLNVPNGEQIDVPCDVRALSHTPESIYEVLSADIPLFSDPQCMVRRENVVGLLVRANEGGGRIFTRIQPTVPGQYSKGQYVTHGPFDATGVGESWYLAPSSNTPQCAWTGSLLARPEILGHSGARRYISIRVLPLQLKIGLNERRSVRVRAFYVDGPASGELDVTDEVLWKTDADRVAFVKGGVLYSKAFGDAEIEAKWNGLVATGIVRVAALVKGTVTPFFQGIRRLQQIAFDRNDNLFFVNQSESVFCIGTDGKFSEMVRLDMGDSDVYGIDCLHLISNDILYVSTIAGHQCLRLRRVGDHFVDPEPVAASIRGVKKGITSDSSGRIYIAVMGGTDGAQIVRISPDGNQYSFRTPDMPIYLAIGPHDLLYVPSTQSQSVQVFTPDGELLEQITHGIADSVSGICVDGEGSIFLPFFSSGKLMKITRSGDETKFEFVAEGLGTPGGIAMDSKGRVLVSDFEGDTIRMLA